VRAFTFSALTRFGYRQRWEGPVRTCFDYPWSSLLGHFVWLLLGNRFDQWDYLSLHKNCYVVDISVLFFFYWHLFVSFWKTSHC